MDRIRRTARDREATAPELLAALDELRRLRDELTMLEPALIAAARERGVSWAALAAVLGVASRQAAERRYLRLRPAEPTDPSGSTADERVRAVRDRRAGDRAVEDWARRNAAMLRQLAGSVSALDDLTDPAQASVDRVHRALGQDDSATLLGPLAGAAPHLAGTHPALADRIHQVTEATDQVRRQTQDRRSRPDLS